MKKILAPHKEQDGWVYWRMRPARPSNNAARVRNWAVVGMNPSTNKWDVLPFDQNRVGLGYYDDRPGSRVISSRRVERAVETDDFLRLCAEEGLHVAWHPDDGPELTHYTRRWERGWCVFIPGRTSTGYHPTLREA